MTDLPTIEADTHEMRVLLFRKDKTTGQEQVIKEYIATAVDFAVAPDLSGIQFTARGLTPVVPADSLPTDPAAIIAQQAASQQGKDLTAPAAPSPSVEAAVGLALVPPVESGDMSTATQPVAPAEPNVSVPPGTEPPTPEQLEALQANGVGYTPPADPAPATEPATEPASTVPVGEESNA